MRIVVVAVGRVRPPFADDVEHYAKLLKAHAPLDLIEVREDERIGAAGAFRDAARPAAR